MKKIIVMLLIATISLSSLNGCMLMMAGALLSEDETTSIDNSETKPNNSNNSNNETNAPTEEPQDTIISAGSVITTDKFKITVTDVDLNYTDYEDEYGWYTPKEGMKYIMASFKFENIDDESQYVSIYDFDCYVDGTLCEQNFYVDTGDFINTNLSPNRNVSFMVCFDVPVNATEIELEYELNMWTEEKIILKLQ